MTHMIKKYRIIVIVISLIILLPTIIYIYKFASHPVSDIPSEWGTFGDYMGGILNPVLSIFSTLLLAYITILLSKEGSKDSFAMQQREREWDIYSDIFKSLSLYKNWEASSAKYDIELLIIKTRFNNLGYEEKAKHKTKYENNLRKHLEKCICDNFVILKGIELYINDIPIQYVFYNLSDTAEYVSLQKSFKAFVTKIEQFDFNNELSLQNIKDSSIRIKMDNFLLMIKKVVLLKED